MKLRAMLLGIGALSGMQTALAGPIALDVLVALDGEAVVADVRATTEDGKAVSLEVDEALRVILTPTIVAGGDVFIRAEVFLYRNGDFTKVASPTVQTREGEPTTVTLTDAAGKELELSVTPLLE